MTGIQIFESPEFGKIRAIEIDGEPWFVGKDVARALGYGNGNNKSKALANAINDHVQEYDKRHIPYQALKGYQNGDLENFSHFGATFINESGVYSLAFSSKLPDARIFTKWVTHEVLPSIRKHGAYMTPETLEKALTSPDFLIRLATKLKEEQQKNKALQNENTELTISNKVKDQQIEELQPKATYYDLVLQTKDAIAITKIAKDYGKSARWLNSLLKDLHVQYKQGDAWFLYQKYADKGYTQTKTDTFVDTKGEPRTKIRTCWTQKGRLFIYELLKEHNILPLIEREELKA